MANENHTIIGETLPYFSEYRRVYIFADNTEMTPEDYWSWRNKLRFEMEERIRQANFELECKAIAATGLMNDMLNGYAPSVAYSRAFRRSCGNLPYST
jgi:predicted amino acid dehydrogenase